MTYTKLIHTGDILELYQYEKTPSITVNRNKRKRITPEGGRPVIAPERRRDNIRRSRKRFIRLVRSNCDPATPPTLLTLTMFSIVDIKTASACLSRYTATLQRVVGPGFKYIGVPEFQKRGAVHYHLLVWGLPDELVFNESPYATWTRKTFRQYPAVRRFFAWCITKSFRPDQARGFRLLQNLWACGFVDIMPTDGNGALAGYLAKYMQKAMHDGRLAGKRGFYASRNVLRPVLYKTATPLHLSKLIFGKSTELLTENSFSTEWLGECKYSRYKLVPPVC